MSYNVYTVYFKRKEDKEQKYEPHAALFIRNGPHPTKHEGEMLHVIEDRKFTTDEIIHLTYDTRQGILEDHPLFMEATHIGSVSERKMESLRSICANMPGVIAPQSTLKPNCSTWIDNVVHDLNKKNVVSFESTVRIPSHKKPLQVVGSSSSSKDKGSSSSSK